MPQLLITAGPTHEPIDAVRYIANRSSGKLGIALALAARQAGWDVTLLLGPAAIHLPDDIKTFRFVTAQDLADLLNEHFPRCDVLIMAAAVADYRPVKPTHGVETAHWSLAPWLLDFEVDGVVRLRDGNRHPGAVPHGAFACMDEGEIRDRWVAIACWNDDEWAALARVAGIDDAGLSTVAARRAREDEIESLITAWTSTRTRAEVAEALQAAGVEAVPVEDFGDLHEDPQLAARQHFETHTHPYLGSGLYERNGFRLSDAPSGYDRAGPTLGQDNDWVLGHLLGLSAEEITTLRDTGALE